MGEVDTATATTTAAHTAVVMSTPRALTVTLVVAMIGTAAAIVAEAMAAAVTIGLLGVHPRSLRATAAAMPALQATLHLRVVVGMKTVATVVATTIRLRRGRVTCLTTNMAGTSTVATMTCTRGDQEMNQIATRVLSLLTETVPAKSACTTTLPSLGATCNLRRHVLLAAKARGR